MVSLVSLAFLVASAPFAQVLGASASGFISTPFARNKVGPALVAACGQSFADFLTANPGASALDLGAKIASNFKATCVSNVCGYYQASDNLDRVLTVKPRDIFSFATNITGLPSYPATSDHHSDYTANSATTYPGQKISSTHSSYASPRP